MGSRLSQLHMPHAARRTNGEMVQRQRGQPTAEVGDTEQSETRIAGENAGQRGTWSSPMPCKTQKSPAVRGRNSFTSNNAIMIGPKLGTRAVGMGNSMEPKGLVPASRATRRRPGR